MRSVGCGFLLLGLWIFPALGQTPGPAPRPSLDEARTTSACDGTAWEKTIADIKAADPERDAEAQIAQGNYTLRSARVLIETFVDNPALDISPDVVLREWLPGVECHLDKRPTDILPIQEYVEAVPTQVHVEDATTDIDKWCVRSALTLADEYAKRFNRRVVRDPVYPHRGLCAVGPGSYVSSPDATAGFAAQPTPDLVPAQIPDVATAARFGLAADVAKFITDGADLSKRDLFGFDALKWSVVRDYPAIFDLLLAASGTSDFCGALRAAVAHDRGAFAVPLAGRCGSRGKRWALLPLAISKGGSVETVRALVGAEPVHSLTEWPSLKEALSLAAIRDRSDLVSLLMAAGVAPESQNDGEELKELRRSLLRAALTKRKLSVAEFLLAQGAEPDQNAVHFALERKAQDIVQILALSGVDLNGHRPADLQPRHVTASLEGLLDPLGRRPPARAIPSDDRARRYADPPIFLALDPLMDVNMVELLLKLGADPNVRDRNGWTPLMVAITESRIYGRKDGVGWIEWYVPQRLIPGQEDWAHRGVEPVLALLAKGADVGLADRDGLTALHHAARSDYNVEIAEILLEHGADVNARDASGRTPLDHARAAKLVRMPEVLVAAGTRSGSQ